jgi:hypothetical protein
MFFLFLYSWEPEETSFLFVFSSKRNIAHVSVRMTMSRECLEERLGRANCLLSFGDLFFFIPRKIVRQSTTRQRASGFFTHLCENTRIFTSNLPRHHDSILARIVIGGRLVIRLSWKHLVREPVYRVAEHSDGLQVSERLARIVDHAALADRLDVLLVSGGEDECVEERCLKKEGVRILPLRFKGQRRRTASALECKVGENDALGLRVARLHSVRVDWALPRADKVDDISKSLRKRETNSGQSSTRHHAVKKREKKRNKTHN